MERIIGRNSVLGALRGGANIDRVYIQDSISGQFEKEIRALCQQHNIPLNRIPKPKLDRLIRGKHQGIYALLSEIKYWSLDSIISELLSQTKNPVLLMLDKVQDVRNLGAIARSAEIFGAHGLIIPSKGGAPINEVAIQSSAGALLHLKVCREKNLQKALGTLAAQGFVVIGADANANTRITDIDFEQPLVLLLGSEGKGIDRHLKIYCDHLFAIEQAGRLDSLNVSVANGIILYEISKQRKQIST